MHGSNMKDWNWHHGGYGPLDVTHILEYSSNVGVSTIIDKFYGKDPQKFIDGLRRMDIDTPLHLALPVKPARVFWVPRNVLTLPDHFTLDEYRI